MYRRPYSADHRNFRHRNFGGAERNVFSCVARRRCRRQRQATTTGTAPSTRREFNDWHRKGTPPSYTRYACTIACYPRAPVITWKSSSHRGDFSYISHEEMQSMCHRRAQRKRPESVLEDQACNFPDGKAADMGGETAMRSLHGKWTEDRSFSARINDGDRRTRKRNSLVTTSHTNHCASRWSGRHTVRVRASSRSRLASKAVRDRADNDVIINERADGANETKLCAPIKGSSTKGNHRDVPERDSPPLPVFLPVLSLRARPRICDAETPPCGFALRLVRLESFLAFHASIRHTLRPCAFVRQSRVGFAQSKGG